MADRHHPAEFRFMAFCGARKDAFGPEPLTRAGGVYPIRQQIFLHLPLFILLIWCFWGFESELHLMAMLRQHRQGNSVLQEIMFAISRYGNIPFYVIYAYTGIVAIRKRDGKLLAFTFGYILSLIFALGAIRVMKYIISRPRPPALWPAFKPFTLAHSSFPSGHVAETLTTITPLAAAFGNVFLPILLGLWPMAVGISRLYLEAHYPSDLLGSIVVGAASYLLAWRVRRLYGGC